MTDIRPVGEKSEVVDFNEHRPERRHGSRRRVTRHGQIIFEAGNCALNCNIVDISETGAKLATENVLFCPEHFVLKPKLGRPRECEVVWRSHNTLGLRFVD